MVPSKDKELGSAVMMSPRGEALQAKDVLDICPANLVMVFRQPHFEPAIVMNFIPLGK